MDTQVVLSYLLFIGATISGYFSIRKFLITIDLALKKKSILKEFLKSIGFFCSAFLQLITAIFLFSIKVCI